MDFRLFWGVIKRYKRLSIGGTLLAVVLAALAYGTPSFSHGFPTLVPRGSVTYESNAQVLLTQANGLYGRLAPNTSAQLQDPGYMSTLSPIYAGIANGDAVQQAVRASKVPGTLTANGGVDQYTGNYLPFVNITATAPTPQDAAKLSQLGIAGLRAYTTKMEADAGVPQSERIYLEVVKTGLPPVLASGHKVMIPLLVLIAVLTGMITVLFSLENHDPRTAAALGRITPTSPPTLVRTDSPPSVPGRKPAFASDPTAHRGLLRDAPAQSSEEAPPLRHTALDRLKRH